MSAAAITLDTLVLRAQRLCSLPAVAMKVLELTANPHVDTHALKQCIENDPALTSKVLRTVNSSLFGLSREVSDLNQALALLGTKPLKMLVLGFSLPGGLFSGVSGETLGRYWRRTLTKAVAGREISELVWRQPGDEAFIAGLLQDIGVLLLIQEIGPLYGQFLETARRSGKNLAALESEALGFDHTALSARLLSHWGLPKPLLEAVAWKPGVDRSPPGLAQILCLAELVARLLVDGQSAILPTLLMAGEQYRGMTPAQFETLVGRLEERVVQLANVLSLELPDGLAYQDVLVRSQRQLADVASDVVKELLDHRYATPSAGEDAVLLEELANLTHTLGERYRGDIPSIATTAAASAEADVEKEAGTFYVQHRAPAEGWSAHSGKMYSLSEAEPETDEIEPGLLGRLEAAVAACRQKRCALSLILAELNQADKLALTRGAEGLERLRQWLEGLCQELDHPSMVVIPSGEVGFALILPDCDRRQAVQLGNLLLASVRRLGNMEKADTEPAVSINVGAATLTIPPKNFLAQDLTEAADRCLYGSRASGGNVMKSIEIY
jgi:HD-like signal output (HDOD) protein/GGDEF domain-containing protein